MALVSRGMSSSSKGYRFHFKKPLKGDDPGRTVLKLTKRICSTVQFYPHRKVTCIIIETHKKEMVSHRMASLSKECWPSLKI